MTQPDAQMASRNFVIFAPSYDENIGGVIALHALCNRLAEIGHDACIWPYHEFIPNSPRGWLRLIRRRWHNRDFSFGPFPVRRAQPADLADAIVMYPETVVGNPLNAKRVVRWLLYRPTQEACESFDLQRDLFAHYMPAFADALSDPSQSSHLRVQHLNEAYSFSDDEREGDCLLIHKGGDRNHNRHPADAILVDGLDHTAKAAVYRRSNLLYSYDPYSMNNIYAAICGCIPVIIPRTGVSLEQWMPEPHRRYGLAYGEERIEWARETHPLLMKRLTDADEEEKRMISAFVDRCARKFAVGSA